MRRFLAGLALAGGLAVSHSAAEGLEAPALERYHRWGPLRARPGFQIWRVGYDNNIFLTGAETASDLTATVSPKLEGLVLLGDRAFIEFRSRLDYRMYAQHTDQNYLDHLGNGRLTFPLGSSFGVFGEYVLNYVHQRPRDQEHIRPLQTDRALGVGMIFELGWRTDVEISDRYVRIRYDDNEDPLIAARLDRDEHRRRIDARYLLQGRTRLTLDLETRDIEFITAPTLQDSDQWLAAVGAILGEGGPFRGRFRLGWSEIDAKNEHRPDFSGPIGDAELVYKWASGTRIEAAMEILPGFAVIRDQTYYENATVGLRGVRYLNRFVGVESGLGFEKLTFPETQRDGTDLVDHVYEFDVGMRLRLAANSLGASREVSFRVGTSRRESTDPLRDRTRGTLYFGSSFGF